MLSNYNMCLYPVSEVPRNEKILSFISFALSIFHKVCMEVNRL